MKKGNKILLGIILILIATILILQESKFSYLIPFIGKWSILALIIAAILLYWVLKNLVKKNFMSSSFLFTLFIILNKRNLNMENLGNWKIIFIGFLIGIGLSLLFGGRDLIFESNISVNNRKRIKNEKTNKFSADNDILKIEKVFVNSVDYMEPMDLEGGQVEIVFSNTSIYLDRVKLVEDLAYFNLSSVFSSLSLYIPKDWEVVTEMSLVGAKITEHNHDGDIEKNKKIKLSGEGVFSSIRIYYI